MEKLDRLGWAAETVFSAYGLRIGVRANTVEALAAVEPFLPPGRRASTAEVVDRLYSIREPAAARRPGTRGYHLVYSGWSRIARVLEAEEAHRLFEQDLHLFIAEKAPKRIFVHAGVVGWRGKAILLPGRTFTGKSTLVAELVRAGATYYSDEYAVLDAEGRVHPFARRLSLRQPDGEPTVRCSAESLGGATGKSPLPVGAVLFSRYRSGARWRPRRLSPGQAVLELLANTVPARERPGEALTVLANAVRSAALLKGTRGDASESAAGILSASIFD